MTEEYMSIIPEDSVYACQAPDKWNEIKRKYYISNIDKSIIVAIWEGANSLDGIQNIISETSKISKDAVYCHTKKLSENGILLVDCKNHPSGRRSFVRFHLSDIGEEIYQLIKSQE